MLQIFISLLVLTNFGRRIGTAPSLSLGAGGANHAPAQVNLGTHNRNTSNGNGFPLGSASEPLEFGRPPTSASSQFGGTMPPMGNKARESTFDEFGYKNPLDFTPAAATNTVPARTSLQPTDEFTNRPVEPRPAAGGRRPGTAGSATGRFTVTNLDEKDHLQSVATPPATARNWLPAEEEKQRLYERARAEVERVQGDAAHPVRALSVL